MMVSCTHDCNISPVEMIFGWPIQGVLSFISWKWSSTIPHDGQPGGRLGHSKKMLWEPACMPREKRNAHAQALLSLSLGDDQWWQCILTEPTKWGKSGTVVEHYYQYWVKGDGSGCLTMWNKCFLHKFTPATVVIGIRYNLPPQHTKDDNLSAPWVTDTQYNFYASLDDGH